MTWAFLARYTEGYSPRGNTWQRRGSLDPRGTAAAAGLPPVSICQMAPSWPGTSLACSLMHEKLDKFLTTKDGINKNGD